MTMRTLLQTFFAISSCYSFVRSSTNSTTQLKSQCLLSLTDQTVKDKIQIFNAQSKKQIFLHFKLPGIEHLKTNGSIYRPLDIVCTNGSHSKEMLLLHPQFEQFSVGVLKFGVEHVDVHLVGLPSSCFSGITEDDLQNRLFSFAFIELGLLEAENEKARVCNQHLYDDGGFADIYYRCCFPDTSGNFVCEKNTPNEWFTVLTVAVYIIYLLVVVCSPLLIPKIWYQESKYESYTIKTGKQFVLKILTNKLKETEAQLKQIKCDKEILDNQAEYTYAQVKSVTINTPKLKPVTPNRLPIGLFHNLFKTVLTSKIEECFKKSTKDESTNNSGTQSGDTGVNNSGIQSGDTGVNNSGIQRVDTGVNNSGIQSGDTGVNNSGIQSGDTGVNNSGIQSVDNGVNNSGIQNGDTGVNNSGIQSVDTGVNNSGIQSGDTGVNNSGIQSGNTGVNNSGIQSGDTGVNNSGIQSVDTGVNNSVTQSDGAEEGNQAVYECFKLLKHFAVLLICLIPFLVRLIFFYILEEEERTNREQFASIQNLSYPQGIKWNLTYSLQPDHPFFIVCYVTIMFIPLIRQFIKIVISSFDDITNQTDGKKFFLTKLKIPFSIVTYIPIVKLCLILLSGLFKLTWQQTNKTKKLCDMQSFKKWALLLPICFFLLILNILMVIPIFSYLVLCSEVMIFVIQLLLYVFIGLVLNTTHVLTYISFGIWVIFYGGVFVKSIRSKYESFCRKCIDNFQSELLKDAIKTLLTSDNDGKNSKPNYAFPLYSTTDKMTLSLKYDKLILETKMPFLYFENDTPFISEDFFMKLCNLHCVGAPGSSSENNKKAVVNYIQIVLFLALVTIIVLAFGEASGITGTYQAVVALGGGLIPLLLKKFSSSSSDDEPIDFGKTFSFNDITTDNIDGSTRWEILYLELGKDADSINNPELEIDIITEDKNIPGHVFCSEIYICPMCTKTEYCKVPMCNDTKSS